MGLLDRFKPQPRWKHADAAVRMTGVPVEKLKEQAECPATPQSMPAGLEVT